MSFERVIPRELLLGLVGLATFFGMVQMAPAQATDFDKKPNVWTIMGPSSKDALADPTPVVSPPPDSMSPAPGTAPPGAAKALPKGLPNSSAAAPKIAGSVDNGSPAPGPLGLKTPQAHIDATRQLPDEWPMLPGIFGRPDNNVGMVWGVVLPITAGEK